MKKFIFFGESRYSRLRKTILSAKKELNRHVYTEAVIKDDFSTDVYLCVDGTRIAQITDTKPLERPSIPISDASNVIDYIKKQYLISHKDYLYGRR